MKKEQKTWGLETDSRDAKIPCREVVLTPHYIAYFLEGKLSVEVDDDISMAGPVLRGRALERARRLLLSQGWRSSQVSTRHRRCSY